MINWFKRIFKKKEKPKVEHEKLRNVIKNFLLDGIPTNMVVAQELVNVVDLSDLKCEDYPLYRFFAECPCGKTWWLENTDTNFGDQGLKSLRFHYDHCEKARIQ